METIRTAKPIYSKGNTEQIFQELRHEANKIVAKLENKRRIGIYLKAFIFPALYFLAWIYAITHGSNTIAFYAAYAGMGIILVLNYLNIIHDAVHHTIFKSRWLNQLYVYLFDIMGANSFIWRMRHIKFHHNYPNVNGWDTDIDQSPLVRLTPETPLSHFHKYQHIYLPFLYPLFLFNWLLVRDFKDFFVKSRTVQKLVKIPKIEYVKLFLFKFFFLFYTIIIPCVMPGIDWELAISAFIILVFTASIFALIVLLPPHANTGSEFPTANDDQRLPYNWFMHMLKTTNDINGTNWFTKSVMGSYNYHIVHHLFPNIHHTYYPEITEQLKVVCRRYDLPYRSYKLGTALKNHFLLLKQNSSDINIWEEDM